MRIRTSQPESKGAWTTGGQPVLEVIAEQDRRERKFARLAILLAGVLHVVVFAITWPSFAGAVSRSTEKVTKIYVVKQVKFRPPPPRQSKQLQRPKSKKVPIPDPTPDEPEPIRDEEPDEDVDFLSDESLVLGVPEAPPPVAPEGPLRFVQGGKITEPVKIGGDPPNYPQAARAARVQGIVLLECVIGKDGSVRNIKVLRGLPLGLTEAAVAAVKTWKFQPSTLAGQPVEVLYIQMVRFALSAAQPG
jgi:TonB family protein